MKHLLILFKVLFFNRASLKFAMGVCLGISFSIAVILSTIGLMDGFSNILETNLKKSNGDIHFFARRGFFQFDDSIAPVLEKLNLKDYSPLIQTEAFIVKDNISRGIALKGVTSKTYEKVTGLEISEEKIKKGLYLGKELAKSLKARVGDYVVLTLAKGNSALSELPLLKRFEVVAIANHGIYQQDMRFAYMELNQLQKLIKAQGHVNMVVLNIERPVTHSMFDTKENIKQKIFDLEEVLGSSYRFRPYWYDFSHLLEAVEHEKLTISLILQLIVVVSIFNALAFIIYLNEKRSKDIFLFQALGLSKKKLVTIWVGLLSSFWLISCFLSLIWLKVFSYALANFSLFKLPGSTYQLERITLAIQTSDYILVFVVAVVWMLLISFIGLWRIARQPVLTGLRKEFA